MDRRKLEPSTQRLRLDVPSLSETHFPGLLTRTERGSAWRADYRSGVVLAAMVLLLCAIAILFGVAILVSRPAPGEVWGIVLGFVALALFVILSEEGAYITRAWHFRRGVISRDLLIPMPNWLIGHRYDAVLEFEIVHRVFWGASHGHEDVLKCWVEPSRSVTVRSRTENENDSSAVLRGPDFTEAAIPALEREIIPDILDLGRALAAVVGVPLWVSEAKQRISSDG